MGMSSSQARLLNLTSRMHQIEYKAAKLEAQKLQMANESSRVYDEYQNALEATKIQYQFLDTDGSIGFKDASVAALENGFISGYTGETSTNTLFLQNQDGLMIVTKEIADKYNLSDTPYTGTLDEYLENVCGLTKSTRVASFNTVANEITASNDNRTYTPVENTSSNSALKNVINSEINAGTATLVISSAQDFAAFLSSSDCSDKDITLTNDIDMSGVSYTTMNRYTGNFNGNGHKISGLSKTLFTNIADGSFENAELSGSVNGRAILVENAIRSTVKNVTSSGSVYYDQDSVYNSTGNAWTAAGLIAQVDNSTVSNCSWDGSVTSNGIYAGGIFGNIINGSNVSNCSSSGTVTGDCYCGGFACRVSDSSTVSNCTSDCNVVVNNKNVTNTSEDRKSHPDSGVFAALLYDGTLSYCSANGTLNADGLTTSEGGVTAGVGAFIGVAVDGTVEHCDADVTITVDNEGATDVSTSGFIAAVPNSGSNLTINNCNTTSTLPSSTAAYGFITGISSGSTISGTNNYSSVSCANGQIYTGNGSVSGLSVNAATPNTNNITVTAPALSTTAVAGKTYTVDQYVNGSAVEVSYSGLKSNIKNSVDRAFGSVTDAQIEALLGTLSANETASLNTYTATYLKTNFANVEAAQSDAFISALQNALATGDKTKISAYLNANSSDICSVNKTDSKSCSVSGSFEKAQVKIPSNNDIAKEIFYSLEKKNGQGKSPYTLAQITSWVSGLTDVQKANLNNDIVSGNTDSISTAIASGTYDNTSLYSDSTKYTISQMSDKGITPVYEQYWDTSDSAVSSAMAAYTMATKGVVIVEEPMASSYEYLVNLLNSGEAVLTTYNPAGTATDGMSEEEYNEAMGIVNTSVSVETGLREVSDETNLKKAEAKYEADMKKIDNKDKKYDTDLAALETERTAIKEEMETLKTVAKENVERTFKLFS